MDDSLERLKTRAPSASACEPYRALIAEAFSRGHNAVAIWQDLVDDHGFSARYASVRRFVLALRGLDELDPDALQILRRRVVVLRIPSGI
jgi:hypothetical protein